MSAEIHGGGYRAEGASGEDNSLGFGPLPRGLRSDSSADMLEPDLRQEAVIKVKKSDVYKHCARCVSIIAGYAATALAFGSIFALGLTPIGWAAIGAAAIALLIIFIAMRRRAQNQEGVPTDTGKEVFKNILAALTWPVSVLIELRDLIKHSLGRKNEVPPGTPAPDVFGRDDDTPVPTPHLSPSDPRGISGADPSPGPHAGVASASGHDSSAYENLPPLTSL